MKHDAKIYIAGHRGLVGSALLETLKKNNYNNIITHDVNTLDLRNQQAVNAFFAKEQPEYIFLAAAKVGGIKANTQYPADFIYDNLMIAANVIHAAYLFSAKKLLFLGSSCIYPRLCSQPIKEEYLLTNQLEKTNEPYAIAKIAGLKLCESYNKQYGTNFIACMPTNLYGPRDNFDLESSHVIPALIAKVDQAKDNKNPSLFLWGTGKPRREFLYIDDLVEALLHLMNNYNKSALINIGTGKDISIAELAGFIKEIVGYKGKICFNQNQLDGTPQKLLNIDRIAKLGWHAKTSLKEGLQKTYEWYCMHKKYKEILIKRPNKIVNS
ncbi:MAG: GDP-L-fucose synthase [Candidatus Babeliales bacterium]